MVRETIDRYGRIDVLINNAGISGAMDNGLEVEDGHWQKVIDINLTSVYLCTKYVGNSSFITGTELMVDGGFTAQ